MKGKTLKDLTKEQIGELFPIEISDYSADWPMLFDQEKELIINTVPHGLVKRIEHFGSTSIPGLAAKNTIDILMEVEFETDRDQQLVQSLTTIGYDFNWQTEGDHTHMVFIKGYDPANPTQQTYHVHAGPKEHPLWDRILFRDYLINHPAAANEYELLKKHLAERYKHERVAYRIAKTDFVKRITELAKRD